MMNGRVGSLQKWSRLELNYSSHVVVMIFVQVLSVLLLSFMSIYWIETQGYQAAYLDLRHYISTLQNFGITFGATFLVFASFVPIDIFMLWEICRFVQGLFINFDDQMYCAETQKHARSQAAQVSLWGAEVCDHVARDLSALCAAAHGVARARLPAAVICWSGSFFFVSLRDEVSAWRAPSFFSCPFRVVL